MRASQQPAEYLDQAVFVEHVGKHTIVPHVQAGLERVREDPVSLSGLGEEAAHDLEHAVL